MDTLNIFLLALTGTWLKVIQFFVALSVLIVIHEFGHYLAARLTKTRVEKFYLFFDFMFPLPNVLNFSLFKKKIGDTEYGMGWFPLGGYVSIAGMIDETKDTADMPEEPQPWEYRSKKSWQKLMIMLGGVIMNVVLALVIYSVVFANYGESYLPLENAKYGMHVDSLFQSIGFEEGDKIVKVGDKVPKGVRQIFLTAFLDEAKTFTVERNGQQKEIAIPEGTIGAVLKSKRFDMLSPRVLLTIDTIDQESPNKSLFQVGDRLIGINGVEKIYAKDFSKYIREVNKDSNGNYLSEMPISILRNTDTINTLAKLDTSGLIGIYPPITSKQLDVVEVEYSGLSAVPRAFSFTYEKIRDYLVQLRLIFTSPEIKINESVGGFISIGKIFPGVFSMYDFLMLTAMISLILAVMNLIPIPGLDGGYVLFLLVEMITGRKVSDKVIEKANSVGLLILLALMLYVNGLDVFRLFK